MRARDPRWAATRAPIRPRPTNPTRVIVHIAFVRTPCSGSPEAGSMSSPTFSHHPPRAAARLAAAEQCTAPKRPQLPCESEAARHPSAIWATAANVSVVNPLNAGLEQRVKDEDESGSALERQCKLG